MNSFVFVYGTLKKEQRNHYLLSSSKFIGGGATKQSFLVFGHSFPLARLPKENDNLWFAAKLKGEVYDISPSVMKHLDRLEGHPNFYKRRLTKIDGFQNLSIWMYHWADENGKIPREINHATYVDGDRVHDW